jgi:pyruvate kinase
MPIDTTHTLLDRKRTKIVATLGPASSDPETLDDLIAAGVDVFRLNLSHGDASTHAALHAEVRRAAQRAGRYVGVLADLPGPKIRVGALAGGEIPLETHREVTITTREILGRPGLIPCQYTMLAQDVSPGDTILLDDGNLELEVLNTTAEDVLCRVLVGGVLRDHKGINLPGVRVSAPALTDKDRELARFALDLGVDFLALSFVRRAEDLRALRSVLDQFLESASSDSHGSTLLIAKIEKAEALQEIEDIIQEADGIMVARGDLGVELKPEKVPPVQRQLVEMARDHEKPVIVATQMLESMTRAPRPTRAEVMDVSNAVAEGADAVMLSGETAVGAYPVKAVEMMNRVIRETEGYLWPRGLAGHAGTAASRKLPPLALEDAVARATAQLSRDLQVRCIVVFTRSGWTAGKVCAGRPQAPILSVTPDSGACRRTSLYWGVEPVKVDSLEPDRNHDLTRSLAKESGLASDDDYVLVVRGFSWDPKLNAPTLTVCRV